MQRDPDRWRKVWTADAPRSASSDADPRIRGTRLVTSQRTRYERGGYKDAGERIA